MTDVQRRVLKVQWFFPPREKYIQPGRAVTAQKKNTWDVQRLETSHEACRQRDRSDTRSNCK